MSEMITDADIASDKTVIEKVASTASSLDNKTDPSLLDEPNDDVNMHQKSFNEEPPMLSVPLLVVTQITDLPLQSTIKMTDEIPDEFYCPISLKLLIDPVITSNGFSFEREQIEKWLKSNNRCPITNEPLKNTVLIPNHALRMLISKHHSNAFTSVQQNYNQQLQRPISSDSGLLCSSSSSSNSSNPRPNTQTSKPPSTTTTTTTTAIGHPSEIDLSNEDIDSDSESSDDETGEYKINLEQKQQQESNFVFKFKCAPWNDNCQQEEFAGGTNTFVFFNEFSLKSDIYTYLSKKLHIPVCDIKIYITEPGLKPTLVNYSLELLKYDKKIKTDSTLTFITYPTSDLTDKVPIFVDLQSGARLTFSINLDTTSVLKLKKCICWQMFMPPDQQQLVYAGEKMVDTDKLSKHIIRGSTVHLLTSV